jgi:uncharacterized repeat protein (TIGR03803 family)
MDRTYLPVSPNCLSAILVLVVIFAGSASAQSSYSVIYRFPNESRGYSPGELIADSTGTLYGGTQYGGTFGNGVLYRLAPPGKEGGRWKETVLHSFKYGFFGAGVGSFTFDRAGNLYGTASAAGQHNFGLVFKVTAPSKPGADWTETTIYSFKGWDGYEPSGLTVDQEGNLYGATYWGGRECAGYGCGTIYKLTPPAHGGAWKRTVLYFFKGVLGKNGSGDGANPFSVVLDGSGNLYGVTNSGGQCQQGACYGAVFELRAPTKNGGIWTEHILYRFSPNNGLVSGVVFDTSGALYGATLTSVYQLAKKDNVWTYTDLRDFNGGSGGYYLLAGVTPDEAGNVYGTTEGGGDQSGNGIVFQLAPPGKNGGAWTETVLHQFAAGTDGNSPAGNLVFGKAGLLYGTTLIGGSNNPCGIYKNPGCGTVFAIAP